MISSTEIVVHDAFGLYAETVEHADYGFRHGARAAHVVFNVFRCIVVLEVGVEHHLMYKASGVFHAGCIGCGVGTVQEGQRVEAEVEGIGVLATVFRR